LALSLVAGCSDQVISPTEDISPSFTVVGEHSPSVNGNAILPPELYDGILATYAFQARSGFDGSVSGTLVSVSRGEDIRVKADLDCLVVNGNEAILGGVVTHLYTGPEFPGVMCVGDRIWWKVKDNGEGANAPADEQTGGLAEMCGMFTFTECSDYPVVGYPDFVPEFIPIWAGNIQVKQ
jgi:hypothetical protein